MAFAELKNPRGMSGARLRGISNVQTKALMAAVAHDVLKIARGLLRFIKAVEARASKALSPMATRSYFSLRLILAKA